MISAEFLLSYNKGKYAQIILNDGSVFIGMYAGFTPEPAQIEIKRLNRKGKENAVEQKVSIPIGMISDFYWFWIQKGTEFERDYALTSPVHYLLFENDNFSPDALRVIFKSGADRPIEEVREFKLLS